MPMSVEYNYPLDQIPFYLFVITVLLSLAAFTWQFRKAPGAKPQIYGLVCKGAWLLSMVLASVNTGLEDKMLWIKLHHMASILSPYLWFELIVQISEQDKKMPAVVRYGFWGVLGCLWLAILSNSWHGLFLREVWLDGQTVKGIIGPVLIAAKVISYLFCAITLVLSVRWVLITVGLRRRQALWFTLSGLFSLFGAILYYVPAAQVITPLPSGFLLSGLFITWVFYRWQAYNILPLAQEAVVRNMIDGLLVVDEHGYIADMNPAAKTIFAELPAVVGGKFEELAAVWPAVAQACGNPGLESMEAVLEYPAGSRCYQLNATSLQTGGHWLGKVIVLKDITEQKRDQAKMVEQQKALSIMRERERLGRELHDGHGQLWSYINMQVEATRSLLDKKDLTQADLLLEKLAGVTREMHVDIREAITGLQIAATIEQGVWQSLAEYLQWFEQNYGIGTELMISNEFTAGLLLPTTEVQLLRIIQEALTNIRKHAGAHQIKVIIRINGSLADIRVEDDGRGFDLAVTAEKKGSFGLKIMQERAAEIGAQLQIQSEPGAGTKVMLQVPLTAERKFHDESIIS